MYIDKKNPLNVRCPNMLRDALHNLSASENGNDHQFGKGVLLGVVSTLMSDGRSFDQAFEAAKAYFPPNVHPKRIPTPWPGSEPETTVESDHLVITKHRRYVSGRCGSRTASEPCSITSSEDAISRIKQAIPHKTFEVIN